MISKPAFRLGLIFASPPKMKRVGGADVVQTRVRAAAVTVVPVQIVRLTWPDTVRDMRRLPLRAVVASSSATLSSRSAQQSPPRSAACADAVLNNNPVNTATMPRAASLITALHPYSFPSPNPCAI